MAAEESDQIKAEEQQILGKIAEIRELIAKGNFVKARSLCDNSHVPRELGYLKDELNSLEAYAFEQEAERESKSIENNRSLPSYILEAKENNNSNKKDDGLFSTDPIASAVAFQELNHDKAKQVNSFTDNLFLPEPKVVTKEDIDNTKVNARAIIDSFKPKDPEKPWEEAKEALDSWKTEINKIDPKDLGLANKKEIKIKDHEKIQEKHKEIEAIPEEHRTDKHKLTFKNCAKALTLIQSHKDLTTAVAHVQKDHVGKEIQAHDKAKLKKTSHHVVTAEDKTLQAAKEAYLAEKNANQSAEFSPEAKALIAAAKDSELFEAKDQAEYAILMMSAEKTYELQKDKRKALDKNSQIEDIATPSAEEIRVGARELARGPELTAQLEKLKKEIATKKESPDVNNDDLKKLETMVSGLGAAMDDLAKDGNSVKLEGRAEKVSGKFKEITQEKQKALEASKEGLTSKLVSSLCNGMVAACSLLLPDEWNVQAEKNSAKANGKPSEATMKNENKSILSSEEKASNPYAALAAAKNAGTLPTGAMGKMSKESH